MKIDIPELDFSDDSRGVSPVIGVILMVAITVILAAVIGAFVLDLGSNLGSTGPQTQLAASPGDTGGNISLTHKGGDALPASEITVQVNGIAVSDVPTNTSVYWTSDGELTVGESASIDANAIDTTVVAGDTVTLTIVHEPSQSILLETEVQTASS